VTLIGANVSYTFGTEPQLVEVTLNCTDSSGNWATTTEMLTVSGTIPEFPSVILPIIGVIVVLTVAARRFKARTE
jgi:hypothetical protein